MTAANSQTLFRAREAEVDSQLAPPAESRTPNWHRAKNRSTKSADGRRMEGWRQRRLRAKGPTKNSLTRTGLLMEGAGREADKFLTAEYVNRAGSDDDDSHE